MALSPLAERIYQTLCRRVRRPSPLITYGDLVKALGRLPQPYAGLQANDPRLFSALEEIFHACQTYEPPLPALTSLVVKRPENGRPGVPGAGYFTLVFPGVSDESAKLQAWRAEVKRVVACRYPKQLDSDEDSVPAETKPRARSLHEPTVIAAIIGAVATLLAALVPLWLATRREESPRARAEHLAPPAVAQASEPPPRQEEAPKPEKAPEQMTLDEILGVLAQHHQRATFGAVAGLLGREPFSLFEGHARTPQTAWVVNKTTGRPTGTKERDYPPGLLDHEHIINSSTELRTWLLERE